MKKLHALIQLYLLLPVFSAAQSVNCSDFTVLSFNPDTTNSNIYQISIQNSNSTADMPNYPHVAFVTDCNGDTIATGTLFWFGHLGQTVQDYPVTLTANGSINCLPLTAYYVFSDNSGNSDTCQLIYATTNTYNLNNEHSEIVIYPNPSTSKIFIKTNGKNRGAKFIIFNTTGKIVLSGFLNNENSLDISTLDNGVYFLNLENHKIKTFSVLKN